MQGIAVIKGCKLMLSSSSSLELTYPSLLRSVHNADTSVQSDAFTPVEFRSVLSFSEIRELQESSQTHGIVIDRARVTLALIDRGGSGQHACHSDIGAPKFVKIILQIADGAGNVLSLVVAGETSTGESPTKREQVFPNEFASIPPLSAEHLGITELSPRQEGDAKGRELPVRRQRAALPKWRLKRAIDYIDAHLDEPVMLADLAKSVGLTSMHFAAQFRAATGSRPHDFLLRRRIERAQELLLTGNARLADVALSVGFQTQAHFTTVFKRFTGTTPHLWRRENYQVVEHADPRRDRRIRTEPNGKLYGHELA